MIQSVRIPEPGTGVEITVVFWTWGTFLTCPARWNRAPLISVSVLIRSLILLVIPVIVTSESTGAGHPFHSTFTEMEWNRASGRFEVALQLPGLQIDDELSRLHQRRINLETAADSERLLQEYIKSRFSVTGKGLDQCQLHWIGMEIDARNVWAYFEVELSSRDVQGTSVIPTEPHHSMPEELTIECRFLVDSLPGQVNMITLIDGPHRATTQLTSDQTGCTAVDDHGLEPIKVRELD